MRKLIVGLLISLAMIVATMPTVVLSDSATINALVSVEGKSCGIEVADTSTITFTKGGLSLAPGDTSDNTVERTVKNTGNSGYTYCKYEISGKDWTSTLYTMESEQTEYKCKEGTGIDCVTTGWTQLPNTAAGYYLALDAGVTAYTDFQVTIPPNANAGNYSQTITITLIDP